MKIVLLLLIFFCSVSHAKNLGTHGTVFNIQEPDLLQQISGRVSALQKSGELEAHEKRLMHKVKVRLHIPNPVSHITNTVTPRTYFIDPSITVPFDLKDHEGRVFHRAGTIFNPLDRMNLNHTLLFIDGRDEAQVAWAKGFERSKIILVAGGPFELMEQLKRPIFFDQQGKLVKKLGIRQVPARVIQDGKRLKIEEIRLEGST